MTSATIVRLPTAARRKVQQSSMKTVRAYREVNPWPGEYELGQIRAQRLEAERRAEVYVAIEKSAAMVLLTAILDELGPDVRSSLLGRVNRSGVGEGVDQAKALMEYPMLSGVQRYDLHRALARLAEGGHA